MAGPATKTKTNNRTGTRARKKKEEIQYGNETATSARTGKEQKLTITAPNMKIAEYMIEGTTPLVQNKFSQKALQIMRDTQAAGSVAKSKKVREPKDFAGLFEGAIHFCGDGKKRWAGLPANGIRAAMVSACRLVQFKMTIAKLALFVEADGFDLTEGTPLIKIIKGKPKHVEHAVRIQRTTDIRVRAMWDPGWKAKVRIRFDADMFNLQDVTNLLARVGMQVGLCEGRPDSRESAGMGWGLFKIIKK